LAEAGLGVERTDFVALYSQDLQRSIEFYGGTLGLRRNERAHEDWPEFETGNVTILLIDPKNTGGEFSPHKASIALRVADVDEAKRKLEEAGVPFHGDTFDSGVCHMAFLEDPDGNVITLHRRYAPYSDGSKP
jgi:catechol 2,3-dioxygenase-like lactoylglutathione lyase family enzyme